MLPVVSRVDYVSALTKTVHGHSPHARREACKNGTVTLAREWVRCIFQVAAAQKPGDGGLRYATTRPPGRNWKALGFEE